MGKKDYLTRAVSAYMKRTAGKWDRVSSYNDLVLLYARQKQPALAFEVFEDLKHAGVQPDAHTFSHLLQACVKAQHPPYDLPRQYVEKAEFVMKELAQSGIRPELDHFDTLMACQGKSGQLDAALRTYTSMQLAGLVPTEKTLHILLLACDRAHRPRLAQDLLVQFSKRHGLDPGLRMCLLCPRSLIGIQPDERHYTALLSAYGRAGDMDGAYAVWLDIKRLGIMPNGFMKAALAHAFRNNVSLAAELVDEAETWSEELKAHGGEELPTWKEVVPPHPQQQRVENFSMAQLEGAAHRDESELNLHRFSEAAARVALLRRLEHLVATYGPRRQPMTFPSDPALPAATGASERGECPSAGVPTGEPAAPHASPLLPAEALDPLMTQASSLQPAAPGRTARSVPHPAHGKAARMPDPPAMTIIVGLGAHSFQGQPDSAQGGGVVRAAVLDMLAREGLPYKQDAKRQGRIMVPSQALKEYVGRKHEEACRSAAQHAAQLQAMLVIVGASAALASAYVIPVLLAAGSI